MSTGTRIDTVRLREIAQRVRVPLVLHGGSGLSREELRHALPLGVAKVNISTRIMTAFIDALGERLRQEPSHPKLRPVLECARQAARREVSRSIHSLGAAGQA
jgi:tagatose 1,6-diphosphate aldolase GatY/KbaY